MKGAGTMETSTPHQQPGAQPTLFDLNKEEPFLPETPPHGRRASHFLLFFALLPPAETRHQIWALAQGLRHQHGLEKEAMAVDRLHLTLQLVVGFEQSMPRLIERSAIAAASSVAAACPAVPIELSHAGSMGLRAPSALALHADEGTRSAVARLRQPLLRALRQNGFVLNAHDHPHITLVYGTDVVVPTPIEPIRWTADRLVLILSHQGCGHHQCLGEWPLRRA
jgi:RNA 2',3'-cyclic 3'-phosphodiesterase